MIQLSMPAQSYVNQYISTVLGANIGNSCDDTQLAIEIFRELSRQPEVEIHMRDQWGNWDAQYSDTNRDGRLYTPYIDGRLVDLRSRFNTVAPDWPWVPLWPQRKPFAVCLTHDVDAVTLRQNLHAILRSLRYHHASGMHPARNFAFAVAALGRLVQQSTNKELDFEPWLRLEDDFGFRSTFFFAAPNPERIYIGDCKYGFKDPVVFAGQRTCVDHMMHEITRLGWDIGLHGSYYSAVDGEMLKHQVKQVEDIVGAKISTVRQHFLHYDVELTPKLQADAGLKADSSQGFNRNIGFRAGTSFPYWCWDLHRSGSLPLLEIPQHIMDGALFACNSLEYDENLAVRHCLQLMDQVEEVGGCLVLNWHAAMMHNEAWWNTYKILLKEAFRRGAWGASAIQVYEWWVSRQQQILSQPVFDITSYNV